MAEIAPNRRICRYSFLPNSRHASQLECRCDNRVAGHPRKPKVSRRGASFHVKHMGSSLGAKFVRHWAESHHSACGDPVLSLRPSHRDLDRNAVASCALHRYRLAASARRGPPRKVLLLLVHGRECSREEVDFGARTNRAGLPTRKAVCFT